MTLVVAVGICLPKKTRDKKNCGCSHKKFYHGRLLSHLSVRVWGRRRCHRWTRSRSQLYKLNYCSAATFTFKSALIVGPSGQKAFKEHGSAAFKTMRGHLPAVLVSIAHGQSPRTNPLNCIVTIDNHRC